MGDKFRKSPDQGPILTLSSESVFTSLHQSIDSVSTDFPSASFTPNSLQPSEIKRESTHNTLDFTDSFHTARIFDGINADCAAKLHIENEEENKLTELCQPSDRVDLENVLSPKLAHTNCLENIATGQGLSQTIKDNLSANHDTGTYDDHVTRTGKNMDSSDASDLLQEIQEENKIRMQGIFSPFHVDETDMLELERLSQEKNALFSENLGLIAKNSKEFKTLTRTKPLSKRVRTRKTILNSPVIDSETVPEAGHKHIKCTYKCGKCSKQFTEMCKLHDHLMNHGYGGSYHYDHILKIAFPKYDSSCAYTQTTEYPQIQEPYQSPPRKLSLTPLRNVVKPRARNISKKITEKKRTTEKQSNKKAHQEKKSVKADQKKAVGKPSKKKPIAKLKVRTKDGGNTWQGIEVESSQKTENKQKLPNEGSINNTKIEYTTDTETNDRAEQTSVLVDKYMKKIEDDIAALIDSDKALKSVEKTKLQNSTKDTVRKRKMSVPKKLITTGSTPGKIVNSRVKSEKKIACDFCSCRFQYTRGLIRHEQEKHADKMKYECEICHMKFMRQYNKDRHMLCAHTTGKAKTQQVDNDMLKVKKKPGRKPKEKMTEGNKECDQCGVVLPHSKAEIHARLHSGERPFICHVCGKGLISDKKLKRHLLIHSSVTRHTCEVCGQGFSMKCKLRTHMFIHTGHKPYLCSVCGAEFNNSTSLLHHHRTVHLGDKRFECKICGGKYGKKSQLEEHMFSHSSERTHTCRYCQKTFKHAKSLRRHEYTHVSSEKFQCNQCDSKFSRKDNLERHKMCHFEVTLQCRFCKKKFREKKPLEDHEQYHLKQKRLQCHICKEKFQDEGYFYNHMEKQHQITKEMLPDLNLSALDDREDKEVDIAAGGADSNLILSSLRMAVCENNAETTNKFISSTGHQDTLNLSMNAAGIIPTSSQNLMGNVAPTSMLLVTQNNVGGQHIFNQSSVNTNGNRARILNQPPNPSFVTAAHILPGLHDGHRTIVNLINTDDNSSICLPIDQSASESMVIQEQQRLIQETSGSALNIQNTAYRLQNLY